MSPGSTRRAVQRNLWTRPCARRLRQLPTIAEEADVVLDQGLDLVASAIERKAAGTWGSAPASASAKDVVAAGKPLISIAMSAPSPGPDARTADLARVTQVRP